MSPHRSPARAFSWCGRTMSNPDGHEPNAAPGARRGGGRRRPTGTRSPKEVNAVGCGLAAPPDGVRHRPDRGPLHRGRLFPLRRSTWAKDRFGEGRTADFHALLPEPVEELSVPPPPPARDRPGLVSTGWAATPPAGHPRGVAQMCHAAVRRNRPCSCSPTAGGDRNVFRTAPVRRARLPAAGVTTSRPGTDYAGGESFRWNNASRACAVCGDGDRDPHGDGPGFTTRDRPAAS